MRTIVIDVDDSIRDAGWRSSLSFDESYERSGEDLPHLDVVEMINAVSGTYRVVGVSIMPEKWRGRATRWLVDVGVRLDDLLMRKDGDFRKELEVKRDFVMLNMATDMIVCAFDDDERVVQLYRELGITAFQTFPRRRKHGEEAEEHDEEHGPGAAGEAG